MAVFFFDPNSVSDKVFLKEGENGGRISSVSMENASSGGQFLAVVIDFGGTEIIARFNVKHANTNAVSFALSELRACYLSAGLVKPADAQALVGRFVKVILTKELNQSSGKSYFAITKWIPQGQSAASPAYAPSSATAHPYAPEGEVPF